MILGKDYASGGKQLPCGEIKLYFKKLRETEDLTNAMKINGIEFALPNLTEDKRVEVANDFLRAMLRGDYGEADRIYRGIQKRVF